MKVNVINLSKLLLTFGKLAAAGEVDPEQGHDAVDDQKLEDVRLFVKLGRDEVQQLHLLLGGVGPRVEHVVENSLLRSTNKLIYSLSTKQLNWRPGTN